MNNTFSFRRFGTYFLYDLREVWKNNSKAFYLFGGAGVILYVVWVLFSLVFTQTWTAPIIWARAGVFAAAVFGLSLYYARMYGFLTERKAGSKYLMIPASSGEKFASMMVISIIVVPIVFTAIYLALDGLLTLVDKTAGTALIAGIGEIKDGFNALMEMEGDGFTMSFGWFIVSMIISSVQNLLFFLLGGLIFKKWKIAGSIGVSLLIGIVLGNVIGLIVNGEDFLEWAQSIENKDLAVEELSRRILLWANIVGGIISVGLATGIFFRIKTLKH